MLHCHQDATCRLVVICAYSQVPLCCTGGRVTINEKLNRQLYGASVTADHILAGDVDAPEELKPLYNIIHRLIVEAGTST